MFIDSVGMESAFRTKSVSMNPHLHRMAQYVTDGRNYYLSKNLKYGSGKERNVGRNSRKWTKQTDF
jgi:hypothetical protein